MSLKSLGDLIDKYCDTKYERNFPQKSSNNEVFDFIKLIRKWDIIVGEHLAKSTSPLKIQNMTLVIITKHSAFAQQLKFMETEILKKVFANYPILEKSIKKISFKATQHFHEIQKDNLQKASVKEEVFNEKKHRFNPEFKKLEEQASKEVSHIEDPEAQKLLKDLIVQSRL